MPGTTVAVVAGSGLSLDRLFDTEDATYSFQDFPNLAAATVPGHAGTFRLGECGGTRLIIQQGRLHMYEGLDYDAVTATVDVLAELGAERIIFTNAAGGLRDEMEPGHLMASTQLLKWPSPRWQDGPEAHDLDFVIPGCDSHGTYQWVHGPCYETRAEISALQATGADAVGMSTLPEAVRCGKLGIPCAAVSCITNNCCRPQVLTHEHVVETAQRASSRLTGILRESIGAPASAYSKPVHAKN